MDLVLHFHEGTVLTFTLTEDYGDGGGEGSLSLKWRVLCSDGSPPGSKFKFFVKFVHFILL